MEILTGILCFIQIVDLALNLKDKLQKNIDSDTISNLFYSIGVVLNSVANDLEKGIYPHGKCMQMWEYLNGFSVAVKDKISKDQFERLSQLIQDSYRVEQLCGELQSLDDESKKENLVKLRSAAGSFIAMAEIIKVK